jgi:hypothetical protein
MGDPVAPLVVEKTLSTLDPRVGLIFLVPGKRATRLRHAHNPVRRSTCSACRNRPRR